MQEFRAGRIQADVLGNSPEPILFFKQQGVLGQYRSPETKYLLEGAWDPDGYWSGITTDLLLTGFNTRLLSRSAVPKNYDDYLKPQFKGQIAVNRGTPYPLTGMISLRGEEQGIAYFKRFAQQEPRLVEATDKDVLHNGSAAQHLPFRAVVKRAGSPFSGRRRRVTELSVPAQRLRKADRSGAP